MEIPASPKRCLAIAMLRVVGLNQKDAAIYTKCANQTVVDVEKWLREEDCHKVARICDDQSIKKIVAAEAIYWGLKEETLVKLDRLTQDDILRHYRDDYLEVMNVSAPSFQKHITAVLSLLDTYVRQLKISFEPEELFTLSKKDAANEKERVYWLYLKDVVPSIEELMRRQRDSESLTIGAQLERETSFAALEGHYKDTELWKDIKAYKKAGGKYVSIGLKLHKTVMELLSRPCEEETNAELFLHGVRELLKEELAPVRVKLYLDGIETDKSVVLEKLPGLDVTLLRQGLELLKKYLASEVTNEVRKLFGELAELLDRLVKSYETVKRLEKDTIRSIEEQKLSGALPPGTKCKFCPTA